MIDLTRDSAEMRRSVAISAGTQGAARVLNLVLNVASTLIIIRYLSPSSYGNYVLVLTVSMLMGLVADFGLTKLATRETSCSIETEEEVLGTILFARLCLAGTCIVFFQLVLYGLGVSAAVHEAGFVASLLYLGNALMVSMVACYVRIKQHYEAIIQVFMEMFEMTYLVVLVVRRASLAELFVPPTVAATLGGVAACLLVRRRFDIRFRLAIARIPYLLREALPLGPALMISVCYLKVDALMLVLLRTRRDVGLYGSAYQPIEYTFLASAVVINVVFPLVAAAYSVGNRQRFIQLYRRGAEALLATMAVVPVVLSLVAVPLVERVYGTAYRDAARPLQILAFSLVLMTLSAWQAFVLLAGGHQKSTLIYDVGALVVAIGLCSIFIRTYGMDGAALATLGTAVFVFVCSTVAVRRHFRMHLAVGPIARILTAAGSLWGALWIAERIGTPWPALPLIALVAYPACLLALRVVRPSTLWSWQHAVAEENHFGKGVLDVVEPTITSSEVLRPLALEANSPTMLRTKA